MRPIHVTVTALALAIPAAGPAQAPAIRAEESAPASYSLVKEKGRIVLQGLPWVPGRAVLQPGGELLFGQALYELAAEMLPTGKNFEIEVKVEEQGSKAGSQLLARRRAEAIIEALARSGVPAARLASRAGAADKVPRVVASESEPTR